MLKPIISSSFLILFCQILTDYHDYSYWWVGQIWNLTAVLKHLLNRIIAVLFLKSFKNLKPFDFVSEAQAVAKTYDCKFIETSTVLNHNVDELLAGILSQIRLKIKQNEKSHSKLEQIHGCVTKSKQILNKIFSKKEGGTKSCENLYVL